MKTVYFYDFKWKLALYLMITSLMVSLLAQGVFHVWDDLSVLVSVTGIVLLAIATATLISTYQLLGLLTLGVGLWFFGNLGWVLGIALIMAGIFYSGKRTHG